MVFSLVISVVFLSGGIAKVFIRPSIVWFSIVDLAGFFLPMCYRSGIIAGWK